MRFRALFDTLLARSCRTRPPSLSVQAQGQSRMGRRRGGDSRHASPSGYWFFPRGGCPASRFRPADRSSH